ncbi:dUTP diphosphatase [Staphylococcus simulans]|uniref:dUTP diphosphatase n=1 Tax=Staphylococcus simulans TaxID=1286 RepID=UPI0021D3868D|nr:dUTP pyrophosphatase [Staphylococcus simulans]UXV43433.1 dUTP pyrophosphatase [Staphylococcus simulans]
MTKLQIKLLSENATMPTRANATDAGYDIYSAETKILEPQEKAIIKTDLAVNIPKGYVGLLTSRSGVSSKTHLVIETGKIDSGFHGNMGINIKNDEQQTNEIGLHFNGVDGKPLETTDNHVFLRTYKINKGDKLAQLVIIPIWTPELEEVTEFDTQSIRGTNGFGSTGY